MTVNEFERYFKLGHGKAITLLRDEPDKKQFQKPFMEQIIDNIMFVEWYDYAIQVMHILNDHEFRLEMKPVLEDLIKSGKNVRVYVLLHGLGYHDEAYECLKSVYEENYKLLKELLESGNYKKGKHYPIYGTYFMSCVALGNYRWHCTELSKLIKDNADLYLITDETEGMSPIQNLYDFEFKNRGGWLGEWFKDLFDEVLKNHGAYERLKEIVFSSIPQEKPIEYKTVEDFYNDNEQASFIDIKTSMSKVSPKVFRELAELALNEKDSRKKRELLYLFLKEGNTYGVIPDFPLSPEPLIEIANVYLNNPSMNIISSDDATNDAIYYAIHILSEMQNPKAKEFCLSLFKNNQADKDIRGIAIETLEWNYTPDDEKLLRDAYNSDFKHPVKHILHILSQKGIKNAPYDLLFDIYDTMDMIARHFAVSALINTGLITDEMLNECKNDALPEIADAAKKEIDKRIMEKRNNKDNEFGWNEIKSQEDIDFLLRHTCAFHDARLVNFEYNPKEAKESPTYMPFPLKLRFDLFFYDDAYSSLMGLEMLCEEVEHFNFYIGVDIIAMFFAATFKFYEKSIIWGADPGPAQETNKYGFADDEIWIKCKRIKWRLRECFQEE